MEVHCGGLAKFVPGGGARALPLTDVSPTSILLPSAASEAAFFRVDTVLRAFASLRISHAHAGRAVVRPDEAAVCHIGIERSNLVAQRRRAQYPCCKNLACLS
jgi:hypothetical protein